MWSDLQRALPGLSFLLLPLLPTLAGCPTCKDCDGDSGGDSGTADSGADSGDSGDSGGDTGDTGDSGGDTGDTGDSGGDSGDSGDSGGDSGDSGIPTCTGDVVTFRGDDGSETDLTAAFLAGTYTTLDAPGTLDVCPGTWFARVLVRADVTVRGLGSGPEDTVLSAGEVGTILDVAGPDVTLSVQNVTLDRGAGLDKDHNSGGGGIYCEGYGNVVVRDTRFTRNFANDGAALYSTDCPVDVADSVFVDNLSEDDGGALTVWYTDATLSNVTFSDNVGLDGGAMALFYGTATLTDVTFERNESGNFAGAFWVYHSDIALTRTRFVDNTNTGGDGGALLLYGTGAFEEVEFTRNTGVTGGGLFVYYEALIEATACDFDANDPDDIWVADYSGAGGYSIDAGADYSFSCASNVCTGG